MQESTIPELVDAFRKKKFSRRQFVSNLSAMGISAVGISPIIAASSSQASLHPMHQGHADEDAAQQLQRHDQHMLYQAQGNSRALHNGYAEEAVVEDRMYDRVCKRGERAQERDSLVSFPSLCAARMPGRPG